MNKDQSLKSLRSLKSLKSGKVAKENESLPKKLNKEQSTIA